MEFTRTYLHQSNIKISNTIAFDQNTRVPTLIHYLSLNAKIELKIRYKKTQGDPENLRRKDMYLSIRCFKTLKSFCSRLICSNSPSATEIQGSATIQLGKAREKNQIRARNTYVSIQHPKKKKNTLRSLHSTEFTVSSPIPLKR